MTTYDPKSIANFFIELAASEGKRLTPLHLVKLVYISHGWHLGLTGEPLINEPPEAWRYGPMIPSLYHALKIYGNKPMAQKITEMGALESGFVKVEIRTPADSEIRKFLGSAWKAYGRFTALQLSTLTHQINTPWYDTWEKWKAKYVTGVDIPEESILRYYKNLKTEKAEAGLVNQA